MAYTSDESGVPEIYIRGRDKPGKGRASTRGGSLPVWRRDGGELFYLAPGRTLMAVEVRTGKSLSVSAPKPLFETCAISNTDSSVYDVAPDGKRFIFTCQSDPKKRSITIAVQWTSMVKWLGGPRP